MNIETIFPWTDESVAKPKNDASLSAMRRRRECILAEHGPEPTAKAMHLIDTDGCKSPVESQAFKWCGNEKIPGSPYCKIHHALNYTGKMEDPS